MASATVAVTVLLTMICLCWASTMAAVFKVGDSAGWTTLVPVNYSKWASSKNFHVGDSLVFSYNNQFHNVLQVKHEDYQSCNSTSPLASYTSGSDSITLKRPGHFYFLCGFPGHCQAGQKVDIRVTRGSSSAPTSAPSPSPSVAVSPSSVTGTAPAPLQNSSPLSTACSYLLSAMAAITALNMIVPV